MGAITPHKNIILIGTDDQVDTDNWGASKQIDLGVPNRVGVITSMQVIMTVAGSGAILKNALDLEWFTANPAIAANTDNLSAANGQLSQQTIEVQDGDWVAPSSQAVTADAAAVANLTPLAPIVTDALGRAWTCTNNRGAAFNDATPDNEQVEITFFVEWGDKPS